ncbi:MAG: sigma-54-dependent Fis family transcriptional regulator [Planctomycetes bacterium]|nr:sigma-54-dependent Fis family transcriptional regulator [Planctomycetota bacterium]
MANQHSILVVEDNANERQALSRMLRIEGYEVLTARNPDEALETINRPVDLVVSDLCLGTKSGVDLLNLWMARKPGTPFIMVTAYGDVQSAVNAMKLGARDYLTKPVDPRQLLKLAESYCNEEKQPPPTPRLRSASRRFKPSGQLVGTSPALDRVREQIARAAKSDSTVTIQGESGTGKELVAEGIHAQGARHDQPFVVVNMAAIPESLVESELFGHVRGSFTGATVDRQGRFAQAHGGTLFIDEIGDFPLSSQAKLLRALETRMITPVGGNEPRSVEVRVVAATSRDLTALMHEGRFREDLYYRLQVITIMLPPLRSHREDIVPIAEHILTDLTERIRRPRPALSPELRTFLESYEWPGNVRQLRNCLECMLVLQEGDELSLQHLPPSFSTTPGLGTLPDDATLIDMEKSAILQTLEKFSGNRSRTAETLGISVRTLQRRLKEWSIDEPHS